ncbi:hypothetical protein G7072_01985 [Nocardioides sp. HDW12B]|nr:hypothetical protein G7072_01985 [Nocardioides sp. HDW12B]
MTGAGRQSADEPGATGSDPASDRAARAQEAERRRRRDRVFGAVLADTTADERGHGSSAGDRSRDDELRRNVPPHHG